jgi:hypothetical protein
MHYEKAGFQTAFNHSFQETWFRIDKEGRGIHIPFIFYIELSTAWNCQINSGMRESSIDDSILTETLQIFSGDWKKFFTYRKIYTTVSSRFCLFILEDGFELFKK